MKPSLLFLFMLLTGIVSRAQDVPSTSYPKDPAQEVHKDIPKGEVLQFKFHNSSIFPGTQRNYWVYIPAQYKPDKPACLFVDMDGVQFGAPAVFDYLIAKGEMPVTIGVFVGPGAITGGDKQVIRYNRSHEFDSMNSDFVNFLTTELLPEVEIRTASDGREIVLSKDANDHAIAGASSGAICAFTAAWLRPDVFSRVYSSIGTYVSMRGGNDYPALVRKTDPKPLRIFLQDGSKDTWNPLFGNWYTSNLEMEAALTFMGYEVNHSWGTGGHDGVQATAIFPDVMRWLWKGWPQQVQVGKNHNDMLGAILPDTGTWQAWHPIGFKRVEIINSARGGDIVTADSVGTTVFKPTPVIVKGEILMQDSSAIIRRIDASGQITQDFKPDKGVAPGEWPAKNVITTNTGDTYFSQPAASDTAQGKIWLQHNGATTIVDEGLRFASALAISPDKKQLYVAEDNTNWVYSYVIQPDGTLKDKQKWCWLHQTDDGGYSRVYDLAVDDQGNLYAATNLGIQVCDQNGRVRAILQLPGGPTTGMCFADKNFDTLIVICGGKLYRHKLKVKGVPSWAPPVFPKSIGAG